MRFRRRVSSLTFALLLALGCNGGLGAGGCGGCGGGCTPIPGGFPADQRQNSAVSLKLTRSGLDLFEQQIVQLVTQTSGGTISYALPCTDASQTYRPSSFLPPVTLEIFACDLTDDHACSAADENPALRVDEPGHGVKCQADAAVKNVDLVPTSRPDGTVDLVATLQVLVNTGKIPIAVTAPLCGGFKCAAEFDSDRKAPPYIPLDVTVKLRIDPASGDVLAFDIPNVGDLASNIDKSELTITSEGGSACAFGCDVINVDLVKQMLFKRVQGMVTRRVRDSIDQFRCRACEPVTNNCPQGSTCEGQLGVCYRQFSPNDDPSKDVRDCPPALLGGEGRVNVGASLAGFGGDPEASLDGYLAAGGRTPAGGPAVGVQSGGLVLGMMGGTRPVKVAQCVRDATWAPRRLFGAMDFDAEAAVANPDGSKIGDYQLGLALSDLSLDKSMFDAWAAGLLCLNIDAQTTSFLSSQLFSTFIRSLGQVTHNQNVPMLIALRPQQAPNVVIGKGTTKAGPNGTTVPDDPLLTISIPKMQLDFYAFVEERYLRLFSLVADVNLPLGLEFNAANNTVLPVLASLESMMTNVEVLHSEILSDDPDDLKALIPQLIGLVQPQIAGALQPFALPEVQGMRLQVLAARGSLKYPVDPGHAHLALFTKLLPVAQPLVLSTETRAELLSVLQPSLAELRQGVLPSARLRVAADGLRPRDFQGFEYSWRVDGGFWSPWQTGGELDVTSPVLTLQGRHDVDVRARQIGVAESVDLTPARVVVRIDTEAPSVRLELDPETREVRTVAHDATTPDEELLFRYRVAGGEWTGWAAQRAFPIAELGRDPSLDVEVQDAAGLVAASYFGTPADQLGDPTAAAAREDETRGCSQAGAGIVALGALAARLRRRKAA